MCDHEAKIVRNDTRRYGPLVGVALILGTVIAAIPSQATPYPNVPIKPCRFQVDTIQVQRAKKTKNICA